MQPTSARRGLTSTYQCTTRFSDPVAVRLHYSVRERAWGSTSPTAPSPQQPCISPGLGHNQPTFWLGSAL